MSETKRRVILGIGLMAALIYALNYYIPKFTDDEHTASVPLQIEARPSPKATAARIASTVSQIDIDKEKAKTWGADPFRSRKVRIVPTKSIGEPASPWTLSGIVFGGSKPMAIINSRSVSEGDEIDGARVVAIESRQVTLERAGQKITLKVNKG